MNFRQLASLSEPATDGDHSCHLVVCVCRRVCACVSLAKKSPVIPGRLVVLSSFNSSVSSRWYLDKPDHCLSFFLLWCFSSTMFSRQDAGVRVSHFVGHALELQMMRLDCSMRVAGQPFGITSKSVRGCVCVWVGVHIHLEFARCRRKCVTMI